MFARVIDGNIRINEKAKSKLLIHLVSEITQKYRKIEKPNLKLLWNDTLCPITQYTQSEYNMLNTFCCTLQNIYLYIAHA